jgi:hypothetical protein
LEANRLFALANYLGAYQNGAFFLAPRIHELVQQIRDIDGIDIPEIKLVDPAQFSE